MITQSDDGQDFDPDDPLTVILRPTPDHLGLPPGRYERIRRGAARRRMLRVAVGVGLSCAVAALVAVPLRLAGHESPASPVVPLGPPPLSSPSTGSPRTPTPAPPTVRPTPRTAPTAQVPSDAPATAALPSSGAPPTVPTPTATAAAPLSQSGERPPG
ncbi:hypothetical protein [Streptomyces sp. NBC_01477]|uniref:hypothetical protein n=1 Tax=Streptomyces sp. NBC_01477 TaxID=2976015 RepID=UPI002E344133|nr:hypothetical protein [Streptomyces sp. NBC_01477]